MSDIQTYADIASLTGMSEEYLKQIANMESLQSKIYTDKNNNKVIGIGHKVKPHELSIYQDKTLTQSEMLNIFAQDLINADLDLKTVVHADTLNNSMPQKVRESVIDLVFNQELSAVTDNPKLLDALKNNNSIGIISNLDQDYTIVKNAKGEKVKKPLSGLSKRRLFNMQNACKIYDNTSKIPQEIVNSAQKLYDRGLKYMAEEKERGSLPAEAYENVRKEYKELATTWFGDRVVDSESGNKITPSISPVPTPPKAPAKTVTPESPSKVNKSARVYVNGQRTDFTVGKLYDKWCKTAEACKRPKARPLPLIDGNGNLTAKVKVYKPTKTSGKFANCTFIVNPGHGGAMNCKDKFGNLNVNFDPGASNAKMSKKNPNVETNVFIGNNGIALEEWVINQTIADEFVEKIRNEGATVIYIQGSIHSAMKAARKVQRENKIDYLVSFHSNSLGASDRGITLLANSRGGIDSKDKSLCTKVRTQLNKDSWFKGITKQSSKSLGILSISGSKTSSVPGILVETGN